MQIMEKVKGIDLKSKNLAIKGHVCIDLHNHRSGFTERIETENMVTNWLDAVNYIALGNKIDVDNYLSVANRGLGGLFLFDGALSSDPDDIEFPADIHLKAHAGRTTDTTSTRHGSLNVAETKIIDGGHVTVWDFSTSQANGTIASAARTNYACGDSVCATLSPLGVSHQVDGARFNTHVMRGDGVVVPLYTRTVGSEIIISHETYKAPINMFKVYEHPTYAEKSAGVVDDGSTGFSGTYVSDGIDLFHYASISQGYRFQRIKNNGNGFTVEEVKDINGINGFWAYHRGLLYLRTNSNELLIYDVDDNYTLLHRIPMSQLELSGSITFDRFFSKRGIIAATNMPSPLGVPSILYPASLVYADGTVETGFAHYGAGANSHDTSQRSPNPPVGMVASSSYMPSSSTYTMVNYSFARNYLGTKANLPEAITKTPTHSMKVTYTLMNA